MNDCGSKEIVRERGRTDCLGPVHSPGGAVLMCSGRGGVVFSSNRTSRQADTLVVTGKLRPSGSLLYHQTGKGNGNGLHTCVM